MNQEYSLSPSRALQMPVDNSPVKSVFSVFSSTILLLTSLIFLDIRLSSISLSGQVSFGLLFSKSQFSDLVETPRLIYLVFLSLQTLIFRGNFPFFNGLYLYQTTSTVIILVKTLEKTKPHFQFFALPLCISLRATVLAIFLSL